MDGCHVCFVQGSVGYRQDFRMRLYMLIGVLHRVSVGFQDAALYVN